MTFEIVCCDRPESGLMRNCKVCKGRWHLLCAGVPSFPQKFVCPHCAPPAKTPESANAELRRGRSKSRLNRDPKGATPVQQPSTSTHPQGSNSKPTEPPVQDDVDVCVVCEQQLGLVRVNCEECDRNAHPSCAGTIQKGVWRCQTCWPPAEEDHPVEETEQDETFNVRNCLNCDDPDDTTMVDCANCKARLHTRCTDATTPPEENWLCVVCRMFLQKDVTPETSPTSTIANLKEKVKQLNLFSEAQHRATFSLNQQRELSVRIAEEAKREAEIAKQKAREEAAKRREAEKQAAEEIARLRAQVANSQRGSDAGSGSGSTAGSSSSLLNDPMLLAMQKQLDEMNRQRIEDQKRLERMLRKQKDDGHESDGSEHSVASTVAAEAVTKLAVTLGRQAIQPLPEFRGSIKEWPLFERSFNQSREEGQFTETQLISRIRAALRPPALDKVSGTLMFAASAAQVMDELRLEYGRPELFVAEVVANLLKLPRHTSETDPALKTLSVEVNNFVASCKALKIEYALNDSYSLTQCSSKLHFHYACEWNRLKKSDPQANWATFAAFLKKVIEDMPPTAFAKAERSSTKGDRDQQNQSSQKRRRVLLHQTSTQRPGEKRKFPPCMKCGGPHGMFNCFEFKRLSHKDKMDFVYKNKICASCVSSKEHTWKECPTKRECKLQGCKKHHNRCLHPSSDSTSTNTPSSLPLPAIQSAPTAPSNSESAPTVTHTLSHANNSSILYKIVPVTIFGEEGRVHKTFAFLDGGSAITLLEESVRDLLHLKGPEDELHLQWTKGITRREQTQRLDVTLSGERGKRHKLTNVYSVKDLELPTQSVSAKSLQDEFPHLRGLPIPDVVRGKPQILIGLQHAQLLAADRTVRGTADSPIACKTLLGWIVFGQTCSSANIVALTSHAPQGFQLSISEATKADEELHQCVKEFFTIENFGVTPPQKQLISEENQRALDLMKSTLNFRDGRYEIGHLWKNDDVKLPDSFPMAFNRLRSTERSLKKDPELLQWKNEHVRKLVEKGYARVATTEELQQNHERIWYCPTFVTVNRNKIPPKPRDVADVAAKVNGVSLNSNLLKGPDNMICMTRGLFKFRENDIGVGSDVKEMFHQIGIILKDQQVQRFLWRDGDETRPPTTYVMQRMMFGPTSSPSCAQFVKNHHVEKYRAEMPEAARDLEQFMYVDDLLTSYPDVEQAFKATSDCIKLCESMGFDLTAFQSNSAELLAKLPQEKVKQSDVSVGLNEQEILVTKILGMYWSSSEDCFTYKYFHNDLVEKMLQPDYRTTRREALRVLMKVFDPLGLIAHYLIRGKLTMQEMWRDDTGWDDEVSEEISREWHNFVKELKNIEKIKIPRHYAPVVPSQCTNTLVIFADASEFAFAAVAYLIFDTGKERHVALVMGKSKVAPIKKLTIPQLELSAALLGCRLGNSVEELVDFKIDKKVHLLDSVTALSWVSTKTFKFKTFVAARVGEILEHSSKHSWYYINTKENVADDATKILDPTMGNNSERWFTGPAFLRKPFEDWPIKPASAFVSEEPTDAVAMMLHQPAPKPERALTVIDEIHTKFQKRWDSLVRVVARIMRITKKQFFFTRSITPEEFRAAEDKIFMKIQRETYAEEIKTLQQPGVSQVRSSSKLWKFSPMLHNGLLRMSSRSQRANISYAAKNPVILPSKHPLVELFVQYHHIRNFHMAEASTMADIRARAWVVDLRSVVKRVSYFCNMCKIRKAIPKHPKMAPLPVARVDFGCKVFTHVGVDAFGPYNIRHGRGSVKRWGMIFTCLTYRAVHLEVLFDMSTESCLMAIRRFFARRGWSGNFYSDNGTNHVGAANVLNAELAAIRSELEVETANKFLLKWKFQPAYSPWCGGAWERLIQSIKRCMSHCLLEECPREEVFQNALAEAELFMNRRPLTHISIDHEDSPPLTPNIVLYGEEQDQVAELIGDFSENDKVSSKVSRRAQHLVEKFLTRWTKEYLPTICQRNKWFKDQKPIEVDDVVILIDPSQPKKCWKKGRIVKVHPDENGEVRAADVQLADKKIMKFRSAGRIAVLDVKYPKPTSSTVRGMSSGDQGKQH